MIKCFFDITAAKAALVALSPVYALSSYKVEKNSDSLVLFNKNC